MLVDIGVNLTNSQFENDRDAVVARALEQKVQTLIVTGTSIPSSHEAQKLAQRYPKHLFATAGIHPHDAKEYDETSRETLWTLAQDAQVVAIGECGLDFNRDFSPRPAQRVCFEAQIDLASALDMPLFMHQRDAHEAFMEHIVPRRNDFKRGVVHCFTGNQKELDDYLNLDLHIGITGWICDERRGVHLMDLVRRIPLDRLMIETDCPYLLPRNLKPRPRSRRNEPMYLPHIAATIAQCRGMRTETLIEATTQTAHQFFSLAA